MRPLDRCGIHTFFLTQIYNKTVKVKTHIQRFTKVNLCYKLECDLHNANVLETIQGRDTLM